VEVLDGVGTWCDVPENVLVDGRVDEDFLDVRGGKCGTVDVSASNEESKHAVDVGGVWGVFECGQDHSIEPAVARDGRVGYGGDSEARAGGGECWGEHSPVEKVASRSLCIAEEIGDVERGILSKIVQTVCDVETLAEGGLLFEGNEWDLGIRWGWRNERDEEEDQEYVHGFLYIK